MVPLNSVLFAEIEVCGFRLFRNVSCSCRGGRLFSTPRHGRCVARSVQCVHMHTLILAGCARSTGYFLEPKCQSSHLISLKYHTVSCDACIYKYVHLPSALAWRSCLCVPLTCRDQWAWVIETLSGVDRSCSWKLVGGGDFSRNPWAPYKGI